MHASSLTLPGGPLAQPWVSQLWGWGQPVGAVCVGGQPKGGLCGGGQLCGGVSLWGSSVTLSCGGIM